jgi:hypothetical protein
MRFFRFDVHTLQTWLSYELSGAVLFFVSFLFIASLYVLGAFILVFLPILIGTLIKEGRFGWLTSLFVFIIIPFIVIYIYFSSSTWFLILKFVPVSFFLFYCYLLRLSIGNWNDPVPEPTPRLDL